MIEAWTEDGRKKIAEVLRRDFEEMVVSKILSGEYLYDGGLELIAEVHETFAGREGESRTYAASGRVTATVQVWKGDALEVGRDSLVSRGQYRDKSNDIPTWRWRSKVLAESFVKQERATVLKFNVETALAWTARI